MSSPASYEKPAPWIPFNVRQQLIEFYVKQPMQHPELYDAEAEMDMLRLFMVYGRSGNYKGPLLHETLVAEGIPSVLHTVKEGNELEIAQWLKMHLASALQSQDFHVIVLEHAEQFCKCGNDRVTELISQLPDYLLNTRVIVMMCFGTVPANLPPSMTALFPAQVYWSCPNDAWRKAYFAYKFSRYARLVEQSDALRVRLDMSDDDYQFLAECSHFATPEELNRFCNIVFASVHRVGQVYPCNTHRMDAATQALHQECVCINETDGQLMRVLNRTRIHQHHLHDSGGGVCSINMLDTKRLEDMFHSANGRGFLAEPENTHKFLMNGTETVEKRADDIENDGKLDVVEEGDQYIFDPKTGKEVRVTPTEKRPRDTNGNNGAGAGALKRQKSTADPAKDGEETYV